MLEDWYEGLVLFKRTSAILGPLSSILLASACARVAFILARVPPLPAVSGGLAGRNWQRRRASFFGRGLSSLLLVVGAWVRESANRAAEGEGRLSLAIVRFRGWLKRLLAWSGQPAGMRPDEVIALSLLLGALGGALGWLMGRGSGTSLWVLPSALVASSLVLTRLQSIAADRFVEMGRELPAVIDLTVLAMTAGSDFPAALRKVSEGQRGVVADEIQEVLRALELGVTRREALLALEKRMPVDEVRDLVQAVVLAEKKGASVSEALAVQARSSRQRRSVRAEEAAARAGALLMLPILLLMGCVVILLMGPLVMAGSSL